MVYCHLALILKTVFFLMVAISSGGEKQPKEPGPITRKRKEPPKTTGRKSDGKNDRVKIKVKEE